MIIKVYIVRCSYCQAPLREPYGMDHRPKYFYTLDSIALAMNEANWGTLTCPGPYWIGVPSVCSVRLQKQHQG